ncbi:unnamed protein product [Vitrella brassicaformis CCMP3155]|uniref:Histone RNA hairpin-binding protein RNA-binding domain-containing protein n=1 Tax=Vitrella brassicaformis (strain CCMP3155) TaxID=1169540 RepID=A0A0G4F503_VITBC|nr:unnamed protein product [Vitrella brassicaformis CCMP3155]|eukprot:CEM07551.1 unnamed protein product [Vitrella brassicaformis CCMP3155]
MSGGALGRSAGGDDQKEEDDTWPRLQPANTSSKHQVDHTPVAPTTRRTEGDSRRRTDDSSEHHRSPAKRSSYGGGSPDDGNELDEHRLLQRGRQIEIGKDTEGYRQYSAHVPKDRRKPHWSDSLHPQTPNIHECCPKRHFDSRVRLWRRQLHLWDEGEPNLTPAEGARQARRRNTPVLGRLPVSSSSAADSRHQPSIDDDQLDEDEHDKDADGWDDDIDGDGEAEGEGEVEVEVGLDHPHQWTDGNGSNQQPQASTPSASFSGFCTGDSRHAWPFLLSPLPVNGRDPSHQTNAEEAKQEGGARTGEHEHASSSASIPDAGVRLPLPPAVGGMAPARPGSRGSRNGAGVGVGEEDALLAEIFGHASEELRLDMLRHDDDDDGHREGDQDHDTPLAVPADPPALSQTSPTAENDPTPTVVGPFQLPIQDHQHQHHQQQQEGEGGGRGGGEGDDTPRSPPLRALTDLQAYLRLHLDAFTPPNRSPPSPIPEEETAEQQMQTQMRAKGGGAGGGAGGGLYTSSRAETVYTTPRIDLDSETAFPPLQQGKQQHHHHRRAADGSAHHGGGGVVTPGAKEVREERSRIEGVLREGVAKLHKAVEQVEAYVEVVTSRDKRHRSDVARLQAVQQHNRVLSSELAQERAAHVHQRQQHEEESEGLRRVLVRSTEEIETLRRTIVDHDAQLRHAEALLAAKDNELRQIQSELNPSALQSLPDDALGALYRSVQALHQQSHRNMQTIQAILLARRQPAGYGHRIPQGGG